MTRHVVRRACACGNTMRATSSDQAVVDALAAQFDQRHTGDGCRPTTTAGARRARGRERERGRAA